MTVDYVGMESPDQFIVGYGMDYNQQYRSLPCIGVLKAEVYQTRTEPHSQIEESKPADDEATKE